MASPACATSVRIAGKRITSRMCWVPGEIHEQPVNADADTACRRHAVLHRPEIVLVDTAALLRRRRPQPRLRLEPRTLVDRVVQLAERIGQLAPIREQLEPLGECQRQAGSTSPRRRFASGESGSGKSITNVGCCSFDSTRLLEHLVQELHRAQRIDCPRCLARGRADRRRFSSSSERPAGPAPPRHPGPAATRRGRRARVITGGITFVVAPPAATPRTAVAAAITSASTTSIMSS